MHSHLTGKKRFLVCCLFACMAAVFSGCSLVGSQARHAERSDDSISSRPSPYVRQPQPNGEEPDKKARRGKPYRVKGKIYYPLLSGSGYEEKGVASWYGPSFHGRHTSSGEIFDMYKESAAHKLLPMHTRIQVTNLENGKSVTLKVNDRGPFEAGRVIDLSYEAANRLSMIDKGLARVLIRTSSRVEGQKDNDLVGDFFVHIGSFERESDAACLLEDMKSNRYKPSIIKIVKADRDGEILWRVELGPYKSMSSANKAHTRVVREYPSAFVVAK